jgi:hypothetical protein
VVTVAESSSLVIRRKFYFGLSLFITLIVFVGFWPSYFGPFVAGTVDRPVVIHFHAAVYVGWLLIFIAQTGFAATGRIAAHKKLGHFAAGYGAFMVIVGLMATFGVFAIRVRVDQLAQTQNAFLPVGPLLDMIVFAPFFAAAVYYRRKTALHKRLMIVATTSLLIAAVARMPFLGSPRILWLELLIWVSPILLAISYDFVRQRIVHPIYLTGIVVLVLESRFMRQAIQETEVWLDINRWVASIVAA